MIGAFPASETGLRPMEAHLGEGDFSAYGFARLNAKEFYRQNLEMCFAAFIQTMVGKIFLDNATEKALIE